MKKSEIIIVILLVFLFLTGVICLNSYKNRDFVYSKTEFNNNIAEFTKNTKVMDINLNHNQALEVADYARAHGVKPPTVLINFDMHPDFYYYEKVLDPEKTKEIAISNWINKFLVDYPEIEKLYWVVPKEPSKKSLFRADFINGNNGISFENLFTFAKISDKFSFIKIASKPWTKQAYEATLFVDNQFGLFGIVGDKYFKDYNYDPNNPRFRKFKLIICTEDTLPDFENKDVFLSIDADYISNSGFDTVLNYDNNKTAPEIDKALFSLVKTLNEKHIRPEAVSLTLSPQYLPVDDYEQLTNFFETVLKVSKLPDVISKYKYDVAPDIVEEFKLFMTDRLYYKMTIH